VRTAKKYGLLLASTLLVSAPSHASSITSFSYTLDPSIFSSTISDSVSGSEVIVTGTVACPVGAVSCNGEVGAFEIGLDFPETGPVSVDISGVLSGTTPGSGSLDLTGLSGVAFNLTPGSFNDTLLSSVLPDLGAFTLTGTLDLSLAAGQSVSLPITVSVGNTIATPEPSGQALLVVGLLGLAGIVRYRFSRTA
jgi:hypothetical protein